MNNLIIGISGVARSGKDTFAKILEEEINMSYAAFRHAYRRALAHQLKSDVKEDFMNRFGIDSFTQDPIEKAVIRPFLVEYGKRFREETQGQHWTGKLQKEIKSKFKSSIIIVTDIRYAVYEKDEYSWIRRQNGLLIHVSRYDKGIKDLILPPNDDEAFNDPILEALADYKVVWPTTESLDIRRLFVKDFIRRYDKRIKGIA